MCIVIKGDCNSIMRSIFVKLYYLCFILMFFDAFVIFVIKESSAMYPISAIMISCLYILLIIASPKHFCKFYINIFKSKKLKYYRLFLFYIILTSFAHVLLGFYTAPRIYYLNRILKYAIYGLILQMFPVLALYLKIPCKKIIVIFYGMVYFIFIVGILQYLAYYFKISFVLDFFKIFYNARATELLEIANSNMFEQTRVNSIFSEPSGLGKFIFIVMPLVFNAAFFKLKPFKKHILNILCKRTFILLLLLNLILTKSPIYLVFCSIEFVVLICIFKWNYIKSKLLNIAVIFMIISCITLLYLQNYLSLENIQDTYLNRIIVSISSLGDFNTLVINEPSLATRLTSFYCALKVFSHNVLFGCGLFNFPVFLNKIFLTIKLPITQELMLAYYRKPYLVATDANMIFIFLAETGIVGTSLFLMYLNKLRSSLVKVSYFQYNVKSGYCSALALSLITLTIVSCYNVGFEFTVAQLIIGMSILFVFDGQRSFGGN